MAFGEYVFLLVTIWPCPYSYIIQGDIVFWDSLGVNSVKAPKLYSPRKADPCRYMPLDLHLGCQRCDQQDNRLDCAAFSAKLNLG